MFHVNREIHGDGIHGYTFFRHQKAVSYGEALDFLERDAEFRNTLVDCIAASPFEACRWETPPINRHLIERKFEFVLLDSPFLAVDPDADTFSDFFHRDHSEEGVVTFDNLGGDARLIAPTPRAPLDTYGHLAAFVRSGPRAQVHALWSVVGRTAARMLGEKPLWISTHGGGVAWLHVRLDSRPKYYGFAPYRRV